MKKTMVSALMLASFTVNANDAKDNIETSTLENNNLKIVKIIDFTGTRSQSEISKNLADAEFDSYLQEPEKYQAKSQKDAFENNRSLKKAYSYTIKGKKYQTLSQSKGFKQSGVASWYGPGFHGRKTANGEIYNMNELTAAHKELPLGTKIEVTNKENGKKVVVRVNDRGPFHGDRVLDLSKAAANKLGFLDKGVAEVHIRALH